jgi:hypothetical protein
MPFEINVPEQLGDKKFPAFYRGWRWEEEPASPVVINMFRGTHLAIWAATLFATYALWLQELRRKDVQLLYAEETYLGRFLHRLGFPQILGFDKDRDTETDENIFPLTRVRATSPLL